MSDVDVVAEAICEAEGHHWFSQFPETQDTYRRMAQAAIDALQLKTAQQIADVLRREMLHGCRSPRDPRWPESVAKLLVSPAVQDVTS